MTAFTILTPADQLAVLTTYTNRPDRRCDNEVSDGPSEPVISAEDTWRRRQDEYERGLDYDGRRAG